MRALSLMVHAALLIAVCQLPGCAQMGAPSQAANATTLDEKAAIAAETAYTAASLTAAGVIDKARFKAIDAKAFEAIQAERAAYAAGNAADFAQAVADIQQTVSDLQSLTAAAPAPAGGR